MELEELKHIWNKNKADFQPKDEAQLASMLKGTSRSLIDKLKRSVWLELSFTIVAGLALLIYAFTLTGALKWTTMAIIVLFVGYSFYYVKKLLLLRHFDSGDNNLKANLEKLVSRLGSYLKFYKRSYTLLYPVYFGLGILFGGLEIGSDRFLQKLSDPKWITYLLVITIVFFFISMLFANWFLKKLYGRHLEKLKTLLNELNRAEDHE
jgi:hypothetical protein